MTTRPSTQVASGLAFAILTLPCLAQDIEPRRWSHLPLGSNFGGVAYAFTEGDITLNPVLRIEDGEFEMHTAAFKYIHAFELLGKSARVDLTQYYQSGSWSGLLNGAPAATDRDGWADTNLRFAVNLSGAPPLAGEEFVEYRKAADCETIVGMGLLMTFPTGEYFEDKLINLGFGLSAGMSLSRNFGLKIAYIGIRTREDTGSDNDTFTIGCSLQW